jgi:hypothetical protein
MKKSRRALGANCSGQLLIVAALAVAILISSTTIYVYELSRETTSSDNQLISELSFELKQSTKNVVIGSLANVSNGGDRTVLVANLNELSQAIRNLHHFGICNLTFAPLNDSTYDRGTWFSWNTSSIDVSSVCVDFTLNVRDVAAETTVNYAVNITTAFAVNGSYVLEGAEKDVNLTCKTYNEGEPALAKNMTVFYESIGNWMQVNPSNLTTVDYGNGTYLQSFAVPSDVMQILVNVYDSREILVQSVCVMP